MYTYIHMYMYIYMYIYIYIYICENSRSKIRDKVLTLHTTSFTDLGFQVWTTILPLCFTYLKLSRCQI